MTRTILALATALALSGCAGDRLLAKRMTQDTYTKEQVAEIIADCAELAEAGKPDLSGLCAGYRPKVAVAAAAAPTWGGYRRYRHRYQPRYSYQPRHRAPSCQGLCALKRYDAAQALDRHYNVNAGTLGWFGQ